MCPCKLMNSTDCVDVECSSLIILGALILSFFGSDSF